MDILKKPLNAYAEDDVDFAVFTMFIETMKFTKSEGEIVKLILRGMNTIEMSDHRYVGIKATKFHLTNVYKKLNAKNKHQALIRILMVLNSRLAGGQSWTIKANQSEDQEKK